MYREISKDELYIFSHIGYQLFTDKKHPLAEKGGRVYYHRHIMSLKLGRWVRPDEVVHHIDENKLNNNPDNLLVTSASNHAIIHASLRRLKKTGKIERNKIKCLECSKEIEISFCKTDIQKYCSQKCHQIGRRLVERPSKEQLAQMIEEMPKTKIAKIYGVSDKAIEKWAKSMQLKTKPRGYWARINSKK